MNLSGESLVINLKGIDYKKPTSSNEFLLKGETFKVGKFEIAWQGTNNPAFVGVRCEHRDKILSTQVAHLYTVGAIEVSKKKEAIPVKGLGLGSTNQKLITGKLKKAK